MRGGTYSQLELSAEQKDVLQEVIWHAKGYCMRCGEATHFAISCYARSDVNGNMILCAATATQSGTPATPRSKVPPPDLKSNSRPP